jgi:hypothetical protein
VLGIDEFGDVIEAALDCHLCSPPWAFLLTGAASRAREQ